MKILSIICFAFFLVSCSTTTEIFKGDEVIWTVKSKSDALVSYKKGDDEEFVVDNRGTPSFIETVFSTLFMKTDINVGSSD